jgi:methylated-DNA-[protein]-cysteine S-methyltransferase
MTPPESMLERALRRPPAPSAVPVDVAAAAAAAGLLDVAYSDVDSPVGRLTLAVGETGLLACSFEPGEVLAERLAAAVSPRVLRSPARTDGVRRALDAYFGGARRGFDVPVDLRLATPFAREVLRAAAEVPYGRTATYADLAGRIGRPSAARAVGGALGSNPVCVVVPCHRILRTGGALGGYAGGLSAKRWLLDLEAAADGAAATP